MPSDNIFIFLKTVTHEVDQDKHNNEGVTATRYFSLYFIVLRKTRKHYFWQISKYADFLAKMNKICLKIVN